MFEHSSISASYVRMLVLNSEIADVFDEIGDLLEIQGAGLFRVRAYRNAARVVASWPASLASILQRNGELPKMPGVGADLDRKIQEEIRTRHLTLLDELRKAIPEGLRALLRIPGLGPKRVKILQTELGIRSLEDLRRALKGGRVSELVGFGPKTEQKILRELGKWEVAKTQEGPLRISLIRAEQIAAPRLAFLREIPGVREVVVAGSYRRKKETLGDLDILVSARRGSLGIGEVMRNFEEGCEILASGSTRTTLILRSGVQIDIRVVSAESFGSALHYFTGSKAHNISVRAMGVKRGLKINEYGIFRGSHRIGGKTEDEVFKAVGLPWIPPEIRENSGEIEAARNKTLPRLIELTQIRGDLHVHTKATDGRESIEQMARAAQALGYEYIAITDHTRHLSVARGLDPTRLRRQIREIDRVNAMLTGFRILKSSEVDILEDGRLDLPDDVLKELDLTICSVHFKFDLSRKRQTERIIRAMDHPAFTILGHPSARLIDHRAAMDLDVERVMEAARERNRVLELNAQPDRLDLNAVNCKLAREIGVCIAISTDAHSSNQLEFMRLGVSQARRGWLEAKDVINTRSLGQLLKRIKR